LKLALEKQNTVKLNNARFLVRMKFLATLPENKDAKFQIPINYINYGNAILTNEEIDNFINLNGLIVQVSIQP
jgi:hypothetical protein